MSRDPSRFAVLILTHGRPDKIHTDRALRRNGYTGPIYYVIDTGDPAGDRYRERFGEEWVIAFDKAAVAAETDTADPTKDIEGVVVHARNASFAIARDLGLDYFAQMDDDYTAFSYRTPWRGSSGARSRPKLNSGHAGTTAIRSLDRVFEEMIRFLEASGAVTVAMAQGGDFIGGAENTYIRRGYKRKAMNTFLFRTDRPVRFLGRTNEDVNLYALQGSRGDLFLTLLVLQIEQVATQQQRGGLTEEYLASGTYVKSFYTVMMCPSFVDIRSMGRTDRRLHHAIRWENAVPKIVAPELRRA